jgi:hypothetical protein
MTPGLRVLLMSGYSERAAVEHGCADLAAQFLSKPFSPEELRRAVSRLLDGAPPSKTR